MTRGEVHARVYLAARDAAGLAAAATAESTPGSPRYRHFLSPAQVQARFGQTPARIAAVRAWLRGAGLRVTGLSDHVAGGYLAVSGSLAAARPRVRRAVRPLPAGRAGPGPRARAGGQRAGRRGHVGAGRHRAEHGPADHAPHGRAAHNRAAQGRAAQGRARGPQAQPAASAKLPPPGPNYWVARPCGSYYNQKIATSKPTAYGRHWPWAVCGYTPRQVRGVYGVTASGMTGAGQTVAIVDAYASPTMLSDANTYARVVGDQPFAPGQYQQYLPPRFTDAGANQCDAQGWYGEQTLDVESVHGMAPDARVRFVAAASCNDPDLADALARIVNNHLASIISNSWGDTEAGAAGFVDVYHLILAGRGGRGHRGAVLLRRQRLRVPGRGPRLLEPDPGRLPDLGPLGDLGGRHQPGHRRPGQLPVRDGLGHDPEPAGQAREVLAVPAAGAVPRRVRRRQRRRHVHAVRPARLPAGRGPGPGSRAGCPADA